ncbi:MAG: trehalose-phosphatase [Alphaproteobacteria bacterium]|nr:trehalose-phosphatase [Alphaproteobacteria bacterium]
MTTHAFIDIAAESRTDARVPPRAGRDWALFLDIDGTLLDIASTPGSVRVPPSLPRLVETIAGLLDGALALVSGRAIADIDRLFDPLALPTAGQHGGEIRPRAGGVARRVRAESAIDDHVRAGIERLARQAPRIRVEDKGLSVAFHYRYAPQLREWLHRHLERIATTAASPLRILEGRMVWELLPVGHDKGTAVDEFMRAPPFLGRVPIFVGDDVTDEDGCLAAIRHGGHALRVGPRRVLDRPIAFADPGAVRHWLAQLPAMLLAPDACRT